MLISNEYENFRLKHEWLKGHVTEFIDPKAFRRRSLEFSSTSWEHCVWHPADRRVREDQSRAIHHEGSALGVTMHEHSSCIIQAHGCCHVTKLLIIYLCRIIASYVPLTLRAICRFRRFRGLWRFRRGSVRCLGAAVHGCVDTLSGTCDQRSCVCVCHVYNSASFN